MSGRFDLNGDRPPLPPSMPRSPFGGDPRLQVPKGFRLSGSGRRRPRLSGSRSHAAGLHRRGIGLVRGGLAAIVIGQPAGRSCDAGTPAITDTRGGRSTRCRQCQAVT